MQDKGFIILGICKQWKGCEFVLDHLKGLVLGFTSRPNSWFNGLFGPFLALAGSASGIMAFQKAFQQFVHNTLHTSCKNQQSQETVSAPLCFWVLAIE
ncbi:hypothetical protein DPMN_022584 [Dreissena polymorpha]|uniref:Uncharacterized protein n=1 Tax=Dreissena polymorpha TaxID=45954 RepID=A0A9D4NMR7_DREPO|nr:hypothetical protein DPMN_022584 [Dreissena polymorpha]